MALDPTRPFLISPPFGHYYSHPHAYSVLGSYTALARPGWLRRVIKTLRSVPCDAGPAYLHDVELCNPGIESLPLRGGRTRNSPFATHQIVSLAPLVEHDWSLLECWMDDRLGTVQVEFNLSRYDQEGRSGPAKHGSASMLYRLLGLCPDAIFKLPPIYASVADALSLHDGGVKHVHLSGCHQTPVGELSGAPLRELNLPLVEELAHAAPGLNIIGGGGISSAYDVASYRSAGAKMFSLSSVFFVPGRGKRVMRVME